MGRVKNEGPVVQGPQKSHQIGAVRGTQLQGFCQLRGQIGMGFYAFAVMFEDLVQLAEAAIVHIRIGIAEVAQGRHLEQKAVFGSLGDPVPSPVVQGGIDR